jgi:hypothetical protein
MRPGASRRVVARAIALAFLDGPWRPAALASRAAEALAAGGLWLRELVQDVCASFPRAPSEAVDPLADFIDSHAAFRSVWSRRWLDATVRRWHTPPPAMALARWPVPRLDTLADLGAFLKLSDGVLAWLADEKGLERSVASPRLLRYRYRWVAKRSGGARLLEAPKGRLRTIQRFVLDEILARVPTHEAAHGFVTGRSPLTHARCHIGGAVVLRMDLRAFFADISSARVFGVFRAAGYPEGVARALVGLTTHCASRWILAEAPPPAIPSEVDSLFHLKRRLADRHLPQGAPTSPALANLCAFGLDARLSTLARSIDATYSRYADDLTFSGGANVAAAVPRLMRLVGQIVADEGFSVNTAKTRVMRARGRQSVTGIVVNEVPNVTRHDFDQLKATLTNCVRHGPASQARGVPHFREVLRGRIAWIAQIHPARGRKLIEIFESIDWASTP